MHCLVVLFENVSVHLFMLHNRRQDTLKKNNNSDIIVCNSISRLFSLFYLDYSFFATSFQEGTQIEFIFVKDFQ